MGEQTYADSTLNPDEQLIRRLQRLVVDELRAALQGASEVALINFHSLATYYPARMWNPGDYAIWLGTLATLRHLGVKVAYQCGVDTFSAAALRKRLPDGPILIMGGGDFGDLYPVGPQKTREDVLTELRGVPTVQLPNAVYFKHPHNASAMDELIAKHGNFILMVRDNLSESRAREHLNADIRLVPDMAFGLGLLERTGPPSKDVTWLQWIPGDMEYVGHGGPPDGVSSWSVEWTRQLEDEPPWPWRERIARSAHLRLGGWLMHNPRLRTIMWRLFGATFEPVSQGALARGLQILSSGRVVVTNKLHGHVLSLLSGIPHVVLDNSYGKVKGLYETWSKPSSLCRWADNGDAAREIALDLLSADRSVQASDRA